MRAATILVVALALLTAGCTAGPPATRERRAAPVAVPTASIPAHTVVIEVFGTDGLRFGGAYGDLRSPKSVEGSVPARLTFEYQDGFTITLQKRRQEGELGIQVTVEGRVVTRTSTRHAFGSVVYRQGLAR